MSDTTEPRLSPKLLLGALGVVFGDIGTSPIYTFRQVAAATGTSQEDVLGGLSLIVWTVLLVVTLKYVVLVLRADNDGEGGIVALLAAAVGQVRQVAPHDPLLLLGIAGTALFYGDGMVTPAVSVLSAVEGLQLAIPAAKPFVLPLAVIILAGLFLLQRKGSAAIGGWFGPVMLVWFATLAITAIPPLLQHPGVLAALSPHYAGRFLITHPGTSFHALGAVFLAVTGAEALYADMGHFSRTGVRLDWCVLVLPVLLLNYAGQAALLLSDPGKADNPFFYLAPGWTLLPLVGLATLATIIASQAVISGAFAMTQQAIQVGLLPRLEVRQTSDDSAGQVYVPPVNWLLLIAVLALVLTFRSSDALTGAYGIAVAGTMAVTTILLAAVMRRRWHWGWFRTAAIAGPLLVLDIAFVSGNSLKIPDGGYAPLLVAAVMFVIMTTWRRGRRMVVEHEDKDADLLLPTIGRVEELGLARVPGTAIYLTSQRDKVPAAMAENLRHNHVLHERVVLLTVVGAKVPHVAGDKRTRVEELCPSVRSVTLTFGFADRMNVPEALEHAGLDCGEATFFAGRELPVPAMDPSLPRWQEGLFEFLTRNAVSMARYFDIRPAQVIELGTRVEL